MVNFLFILLLNSVAFGNGFLGSYQIKNFEMNRCASTEGDPISLDNITIHIENEVVPVINGKFSSTIDLDSPLKIATTLQKEIIIWITMPCVDHLGSCTYEDVCKYGPPANETCPPDFHDFPCRCPIQKGTYTIPPGIGNIFENAHVISGTYRSSTTISSNGKRLACYETKFKVVSVSLFV